jgi:hypothetical protein
MQCAAVAATTVGAASGIRAWLGRYSARLGPRVIRGATIALGVISVLAAGVGFGAS